ncbi:hypothetical protein E2562_020972 [Oryza meyeriana var. granulata]|uniref:F-box domain-containing protein n=1 Tax=Oryza meyeriana var. granulata TaxID=110450 RepID=A0A6G1DYX7_9ORYZ|nr:hypothetical protein E2562_020972 [Oryza meyeriana var. granulata]
MELGSATGRRVKRRWDGDGGETSVGKDLRHPAYDIKSLPLDMHDQILVLLPLDEAIHMSVLSLLWSDVVRRLLEGHSIEVVFNPRGTQEEEKLTRLEEQSARHLWCYSLVVNHSIDKDSAALINASLLTSTFAPSNTSTSTCAASRRGTVSSSTSAI